MERMILFGAGAMTKRLFQIYGESEKQCQIYSESEIQFQIKAYTAAIVDNDDSKWTDNYCNTGIRVVSPSAINDYTYDRVLICTKGERAEAIRKQLTEELRVPGYKIDYLDRFMTLPSEKIEACRLYNDRRAILKEYKKGLCIAEVGVAFGDFSKDLLLNMNPEKFYAIDYFFADNPYLKGGNGMWDNPAFRKSGLTLQEFYEQRFKDEIDNGTMNICRGLSWEALETFDDEFFDFVYLDAAHDYESVKKDIAALHRKVKKGGIIQFNDYGFVHAVTRTAYGVLPAVNHFIWNNDCEVIGYCMNENGFADLAVRLL